MDVTEVKVVIVGQTNVGKTCIVRQATAGTFGEDTAPTLGASYVSKLAKVNDEEIRLQIWDTAGQERYRGMTPMYYRGAQIAVLVFAIDDQDSFEAVDVWLSSLQENADPEIITFLVGNKCDLEDRKVTIADAQEKSSKIKAHYFDVSAKTGEGVDELFAAIPRLFIEKAVPVKEVSTVKLEDKPTKQKKSCC